jgi:hypothetical protein
MNGKSLPVPHLQISPFQLEQTLDARVTLTRNIESLLSLDSCSTIEARAAFAQQQVIQDASKVRVQAKASSLLDFSVSKSTHQTRCG